MKNCVFSARAEGTAVSCRPHRLSSRSLGSLSSAIRGCIGLALALALGACGGGGGGSPTSPPPPPPPPPDGITVTGDIAASANSMSLRAGTGASGELLLEIVATSIPNVYGLSFDLRYPTSLLQFQEATEGEFLGGSGAVDTSLQVFQSNGELVIGHSRLGTVGGTSGTGVLLRVRFTTVANGSGRLTFANQSGVDGNGEVLNFLGWIDADLRVN